MTDKEIRQLGKIEMLSIIRDQESELEKARTSLARLQAKLEEKEVMLEECGSIAEASLKVSDVFQAAQAAADSYLRSVKLHEAAAEERIHKREEEAKAQAEARLKDTKMRCERMKAEAKSQADAYWAELQKKLTQYLESHNGLLALLNATGIQVTVPNMPGTQNPPAPGAPAPARHFGTGGRNGTGAL